MKETTYFVSGFNNVPIYVSRNNVTSDLALVFIHGTSHSHCVWDKQFSSPIAQRYLCARYDLRGHGLSGRPEGDYEKSEAWATDLKAVIDSLNVKKVVLIGWSFGGMIISDYIRHFGQDQLAGIIFVNASTRLGVPGRENDIGERYKKLGTALCSNDMQTGLDAVAEFVRLCACRPLSLNDFYLFLGMSVNPAPAARAGILLRKTSNDDILKSFKVPTLLIHGIDDEIVLKTVSDQHATLIPNVKTAYYENTGHYSFWEEADTFNTDVENFVNDL